MDPFSLCSSTRITAWWKYCCPPVKLSPLAMSKHPRSGAPMTCAHGVSPESVCFCFFKSARFEPLADATFFEVSSPSVLESESPLVDSMETSLARKSRQSPSSAGATSSLLASAAAATSAASFFFLAAAFSFFLKLSFFLFTLSSLGFVPFEGFWVSAPCPVWSSESPLSLSPDPSADVSSSPSLFFARVRTPETEKGNRMTSDRGRSRWA
mmetsp:Transcript_5799/g.19173  ORF Transcript_5799/g.19173 Transcript_5799/m.19173 type:complete len:211 (+) Transcript_5799:328-960(+)